MSNFETHFRFYENGGPFPGSCVRTGQTTKLWEVGSLVIQGEGLPVLLSDQALQELAIYAGFVTGKSYAELNAALTEKIRFLEAQIEIAPKLMEKFTHDITNTIGDFVTSIGNVVISDKPIQPKSDKTNSGNAVTNHPSQHKSGGSKSQNPHANDKPFS